MKQHMFHWVVAGLLPVALLLTGCDQPIAPPARKLTTQAPRPARQTKPRPAAAEPKKPFALDDFLQKIKSDQRQQRDGAARFVRSAITRSDIFVDPADYPTIRTALTEALNDKDSLVRLEAALSLAHVDPLPDDFPPLADAAASRRGSRLSR